MSEEQEIKWQPVMMVLSGGVRLECSCGALAIFVVASISEEAREKGEREFDTFECWCQSCFKEAQEEG